MLTTCIAALAILSCAGRPALRATLPDDLKAHVCYLASDSLQGRPVGAPGIDRAVEYIADRMQAAGLKPLFGDSYYQDFTIEFGFEIEGRPVFRVGESVIDYSVLPISGSSTVWAGAVLARGLPDTEDSGLVGKIIFYIEDPAVERGRWAMVGRDGLLQWMRARAERAAELRAGAIIFVSGSGGAPAENGTGGKELGGTPPEKTTPGAKPAPESDLSSAAPGEGFHIFAVPRKYAPADIPCLEITYSGLQRALASQGILLEDFHRAIAGDTGRAWTDLQGLSCELGITTRPKTIGVRNIGGMVRGCCSSDRYLVVGAHYDALGHGEAGSSSPWRREIHNGADDNASGVAALLEAAREVKSAASARRTVAFVAFTAEELGALGSAYFCSHAPFPIESTVAMINLDTVGRLEGKNLIVFGAKSALEFGSVLKKANRRSRLQVVEKEEVFGFSDQNPFYAAGIPSLHLFTGAYPDYHTPDDDCGNLNFAGLAKVAAFAGDLTLVLAGADVKLTPVIAAEKPGPTPSGGRGGFLGIVPDFTYTGDGVRIKGCLPKSPAEAAGLQDGDVIVAVDGKPLDDLKNLMTILGGKSPGDQIEMEVRRGSSRLERTATIGVRSQE